MDLTQAQIDKIKEIWLIGIKEGKTNFEIFSTLTEFYQEAGKPVRGNSDWFKFARLLGKWKKEVEKKQEALDQVEREREISDEEAEEIQNQNRKRTIVLLAGLIQNAQKNPEGVKDWEMTKIMTYYKNIQSAEEAKKKTDMARSKMGIDEVKTIFPYKRLDDEQINNLQKEINESFIRIKRDTAGEDN